MWLTDAGRRGALNPIESDASRPDQRDSSNSNFGGYIVSFMRRSAERTESLKLISSVMMARLASTHPEKEPRGAAWHPGLNSLEQLSIRFYE